MLAPDVIVVGAGIIGSSIAWRLARERVLVTLIDAGAMGGEASTAGAGMLAPGGEVFNEGELARLCLQGAEMYPGFVRELEADSGVAIDFAKGGAVELARDASEWQALQQRSAGQKLLGISSEPVPPPEGFVGAMRFPGDATVDPRDVMKALRAACEKHEVKIHEGVPVAEVRSRIGRVDVITDRRMISCEAAVIAAGAWQDQIAIVPSANAPEARPVRGHLMSFHMQPGLISGILRHGQTYLLQRASGELIAGTSQERVGFDRTIDTAAVADIRTRAAEIVPELWGREPDRVWIGFRPGLTGHREGPVIERVADTSIWQAYGHFRNGILLAPVTADRVAREVLAHLKSN